MEPTEQFAALAVTVGALVRAIRGKLPKQHTPVVALLIGVALGGVSELTHELTIQSMANGALLGFMAGCLAIAGKDVGKPVAIALFGKKVANVVFGKTKEIK